MSIIINQVTSLENEDVPGEYMKRNACIAWYNFWEKTTYRLQYTR